MLPPVFVELKANVSEFTAAMGEARTEMSATEAKGMSSFDKLAGFGKAALFGLGAAAVGVGVLGLEMADKFEQSHAKLEAALKNAGTSFEKFAEPIGKAQKQMEQYGFTNAQTQEALGNLTTALKDPQKALDDLSLAADLAKFKHIDLATAATAVARAQEGNLRALKQLGIDLPIAGAGAAKLEAAHNALGKATDAASTFLKAHADATDSSSKSHDAYEKLLGKVSDAQDKVNKVSDAGKEIIKGLSDAIGGQAAVQAETFAGKMQALKAQSEDVAKNIGMALIPILEKLMIAIKDVVDFFTKHKAIAEAVAIVIGTVLVAAISAYLVTLAKGAIESTIAFAKMIAGWVATGAAATASAAEATAAGIAANLATGGMVLAIGLLVAAIVYLGTHWKETWEGIKEVTKIAWDWIKEKVDLVAGLFAPTAPLGIALKFLLDHWKEIWEGIKTATSAAWNFIEAVVGKIGQGIRGFVGLIKAEINGLISLINFAIRAIDSIHVKLPDWIPGIGGTEFGVNIPEIPMLANGGIVTSPTLAMIGEAGAEAVIPLSKMGGMNGMNIVINVAGSVVHEQDLAVTVRDSIAQLMRRRGLDPAILGV
jgi:hypothetical protein